MDNLPCELYYLIFEYLNFKDLFNLRLTCKKFNKILKGFKLKELVFYHSFLDYDFHSHRRNWFSINEPINQHNAIDIYNLFLIRSSIFYINLKRLRIDDFFCNGAIDLEELNKFEQLETLELKIREWSVVDGVTLSLNNLKHLSVRLNDSCPNYFQIDAPNLESLFIDCFSYDSIKFNYPLSIKCLSAYEFKDYFLMFSQIECLKIFDLTNDLKWKISKYPQLKELHINNDENGSLGDIFFKNAILVEPKLSKIYKFGLKLQNSTDFKENIIGFKAIFTILEHYANAVSCFDFIDSFNFTKIMRSINNKLPFDFFSKFAIKKIYVHHELEDENCLIDFINQCKNLSILYLGDSKLSQAFFDRLPVVSSLNNLTIGENNEEMKLNFKFLNRMYNLIRFQTDQQMEWSDEFDLNRLGYLKTIDFRIERHSISIEKFNYDEYYFDKRCRDYGLPECNKAVRFEEIKGWCNFMKSNSL